MIGFLVPFILVHALLIADSHCIKQGSLWSTIEKPSGSSLSLEIAEQQSVLLAASLPWEKTRSVCFHMELRPLFTYIAVLVNMKRTAPHWALPIEMRIAIAAQLIRASIHFGQAIIIKNSLDITNYAMKFLNSGKICHSRKWTHSSQTPRSNHCWHPQSKADGQRCLWLWVPWPTHPDSLNESTTPCLVSCDHKPLIYSLIDFHA